MNLFHAIVFVDHQSAEVLQIRSEHVVEQKAQEHLKFTRQHGNNVRTEYEFVGDVCDALDGIAEVLVVGGHAGLEDFRHFVDWHRPLAVGRIVGYEVVAHPSENQLAALACKYFVTYDQMAAIQVPRRVCQI